MSSKPSGKGKKLPFLQDTCYRCGERQTPESTGLQSFWTWCAEVVERRGHFKKVCLKKCSIHSLEVPQASTSTAGAGGQ